MEFLLSDPIIRSCKDSNIWKDICAYYETRTVIMTSISKLLSLPFPQPSRENVDSQIINIYVIHIKPYRESSENDALIQFPQNRMNMWIGNVNS